MSYFMVDIEAAGPIPSDFSMICFGAVKVEPSLSVTFYAQLRPVSENWIPRSLRISGFTREQTLSFGEPKEAMANFANWLVETSDGAPIFISDNNGFDWQFINWYFHHFLGTNPFGHSSTNLGSLYKGLVKNVSVSFKHLRRTRHTHNPLEDAKGNAEALISMQQDMGLKIALK